MNIYLSLGGTHHYCNRVKPREAFTIYPAPIWYTVGCFLSNERNDITDGQCAREIAVNGLVIGLGIGTAGLSIAAGFGSVGAASFGAGIPGIGSVIGIGETVFGGTLSVLGSSVAAVIAEGVASGIVTSGKAEGVIDIIKGLFESFEPAAEKTKWHDFMRAVYCGYSHKILVISGGVYLGRDKIWQPCDMSIKKGNARNIPAGTKYRKKSGMYNGPCDYWDQKWDEWYPPLNFPEE